MVITPNIEALLRHPELNIHDQFFNLLEKDAKKFVISARDSLWLKGDIRLFIRPGWVWNEHLKVISDVNFENTLAFSDQTAIEVLSGEEDFLNMRYKGGKLLFYLSGKHPWLSYNSKHHSLIEEFPKDQMGKNLKLFI